MTINGNRKRESFEATMRRHIRAWERAGIIPPVKELRKKIKVKEK